MGTELLEAIESAFPNTVRDRQKSIPLKDAYRAISWVYACTNLIADCIAGVEFELFRYSRRGEEIDLKPTDAAYKAFWPPRKGEINTISELIKIQFLHMGLFGESFIAPVLKGKSFTGIELINPMQVTPEFTPDGSAIKYWRVRPLRASGAAAVERKIPPEMMIQWKYANPYDNFRGMSPLSAARMAIEQDLNMSTWNAGFFQNGIRNPIALLLKQTFNENQRKEFMARLKANFSGFAKGQLPLLVEGGVDVKVLANTMKDLDFVEGKSLTREELCAVYNVPPAQVGIFRYANYANSKEQRNILYQNNLRPKMMYYRDVFRQMVLDPYFPGVSCDFEWDDVDAFKEDPIIEATAAKLRADTAVALFSAGYDQKQISVILEDDNYDPSINKEDPAAVWKPDLEPQLPEPDPNDPTDDGDADDANDAEKSITMAKAKDHYTIYASNEALHREAKASGVILAPLVRRFSLFVRTYGEQYGRKGVDQTYWQEMWEDKIRSLFEAVYVTGVKSIFADLKMKPPDTFIFSPEFQDRLEKLFEVPKQLSKMKGKKISIDTKLRADRIVPAVYALGREQGMSLAKTQTHKWCWAGDSEHQHLHGTEAVFGEAFGSSKILYPGAVQGEKICTCISFPSKIGREEVRVAITKP